METLLNLFVSIVSQPAILVSLIALLGLVLQKKKFSDVVQGTLKTFVGFLVLIGGAGLLANLINALCGDVPNRIKYTRRGA